MDDDTSEGWYRCVGGRGMTGRDEARPVAGGLIQSRPKRGGCTLDR